MTNKPDMPEEIWVFEIVHHPVFGATGQFCAYEPATKVAQKYTRADLPATPVQGDVLDQCTGIPAKYGFVEPVEGYAARPQDLISVLHEMGRAASLSKPDAMQWLPIETAPESNGSNPFLAYIKGHGPCVCWKSEMGHIFNNSKSGLQVPITSATHWMPLPPPPAQDDGGRG